MSLLSHRRVTLAYIGDEQLSWSNQAFKVARHYFVMPSILYLAAQLRAQAATLALESVHCRYFNRAVHTLEEMGIQLLEGTPHIIGFSCYSWNIEDSLTLAGRIKLRAPETQIIMGGPEVSFRQYSQAHAFLKQHPEVDALVLGEGELALVAVIEALNGSRSPSSIPNALVRTGETISHGSRSTEPVDLTRLPTIDMLAPQIQRTAGTGRAMVYQTYRGCPFHCAYCSFHGGAAGIRRFPTERIEQELAGLFNAEVELVNFADAVFDISKKHAKMLLELCLKHNRQTSLLCYAAFQNVDDELAELFESTRIQVGVGLQSVHGEVLEAVDRRFSVDRFFKSIEILGKRRVNYYIDLMYGLPLDTPQKFAETFNRVMALHPPFVMPFPLTVIPRSEVAADPSRFGIVPYEDAVLRHNVKATSGMVYADIGLYEAFDLTDLQRFDDLATALFFVFQRYPMTFRALAEYARETRDRDHRLTAIRIFEQTGLKIRELLRGEPIDIAHPPLLDGAMRDIIYQLFDEMGSTRIEQAALQGLIKLEATAAHLLNRPDRRSHFRASRDKRPRELHQIPNVTEGVTVALKHPARLHQLHHCYTDVVDLPRLRERIGKRDTHTIVLAPYDDWQVRIVELSPLQHAICAELPTSREMRLGALEKRLRRRTDRRQISPALSELIENGVLSLYRPPPVSTR